MKPHVKSQVCVKSSGRMAYSAIAAILLPRIIWTLAVDTTVG